MVRFKETGDNFSGKWPFNGPPCQLCPLIAHLSFAWLPGLPVKTQTWEAETRRGRHWTRGAEGYVFQNKTWKSSWRNGHVDRIWTTFRSKKLHDQNPNFVYCVATGLFNALTILFFFFCHLAMLCTHLWSTMRHSKTTTPASNMYSERNL